MNKNELDSIVDQTLEKCYSEGEIPRDVTVAGLLIQGNPDCDNRVLVIVILTNGSTIDILLERQSERCQNDTTLH